MDTEQAHGSTPFIIHDCPLAKWPCVQWSLNEWADKCGEVRFKFRVHATETDQAHVKWENEAIDHVEATVQQLVNHMENRKSEDEQNPFDSYPPNQFNFYSSYNYMHQLFSSNSEILNSIRWTELELDEPKLSNDGSNSTLWIGTNNSYTPCHMDTYGYNFVAQLYGKKRWILFPPTDTANLYTTRIPFEESSIFSRINLHHIDLDRFPLFRNTSPRFVEIEAGQLLYVPRHWWHFVQNVSSETNGISISVNTWINGNNERDNSISECLVQFLAKPLFDAYGGNERWLNTNADLLPSVESARILQSLLIESDDHCLREDPIFIERNEDNNKRIRTERCQYKKHYLNDVVSIEDIVRLGNLELFKSGKHNDPSKTKQNVNMCQIVNCILDPEVIDLIKCKLKMCTSSSISNCSND